MSPENPTGIASETAATHAKLRTASLSVIAACVLVLVKLGAGLATGSLGLLAEAAHSGTDLVAAALTLFALRVATRPADRHHQYGHGKAEHLAALGESAFLALISAFIAYQALERLLGGAEHHVEAAWWALAILGVVIVIDASRALVSFRAARRYESPALASNGLHFTSDLGGSTAVLIGLVFVGLGYEEADAIAALLVALFVVVAAARLAAASAQVLMDRAPVEAQSRIEVTLAELDDDVEVRRMRIRHAAGHHFVDLVVGIPADTGLTQAHATADDIERAVRRALPNTDVLVHVEPLESATDLRQRAAAAAWSVPEVREVHNIRVMRVGDRHELSLHVKLPLEQTLEQAHETVTRLERRIHEAVPEFTHIHTHIEPLGATVPTVPPSGEEVAGDRALITEVVVRHTGAEPSDVRFRDSERGRIALVTASLPGGQSLEAAHRRAGMIESDVRDERPQLADVIVHTEPSEAARRGEGAERSEPPPAGPPQGS